MASSLFEKIFYKNLAKARKESDLHKFEEDMGNFLVGEFSWKRIDPLTKKIIEEGGKQNQLTEISKSTVIRLISQAISPHVGQVVPENLKISRMRFGNAPFADHNTSDDLKLAYYDLDEKVFRDNATTPPGGAPFYCGAGGGNVAIASEAPASASKIIPVASFGVSWAVGQTIEINITDPVDSVFQYVIEGRPPSHKTFSVQFRNASNVVLEELLFNTVYSRDSAGNAGTQSVVPADPISVPASTVLVWNQAQQKWKLRITLTSNVTNLLASTDNVRIQFKVGKFNIANSVVPRTGSNAGTGNSSTRFTSLDYYDVLGSATQYTDAPLGGAIDDYQVTFSCIMNGSEGNGIMGNTYKVVYTEAFLMTADDSVFSIVRFDAPPPYGAGTTGWAKDSASAFLLSWGIKAAI